MNIDLGIIQSQLFKYKPPGQVEYIVVAGGGGGEFGGGGAGGLVYNSSFAPTVGATYTAVVGAGGTNANGTNSYLTTTTGYLDYATQFNGGYLTLNADSNVKAFGTGNFTVEAWVYVTSFPSSHYICDSRSSGIWAFGWGMTGGYGTRLQWWRDGVSLFSYEGISPNRWYHVAVVRSGTGNNQMALYIDGIAQVTTTDSTNYTGSAGTFHIGSRYTNDYAISGYISNFRIVTGVAVYTSNFTPPSAPLTAVGGTSLLACQNITFVDNSSNSATITSNGSVSNQYVSISGTATIVTTAIGGGRGGQFITWLNVTAGSSGGSGGGGAGKYNSATAGGIGIVGQGNNGGAGGAFTTFGHYEGGGGGGAGATGGGAGTNKGGDGGAGLSYFGNYYAGGGGGGFIQDRGAGIVAGGTGGLGGGGSGGGERGIGTQAPVYPTAAVANTGGGGGGGSPSITPTAGGSGVVVFRHSDGFLDAVTTGSVSYSNSGGYKTYTFTGSGTIAWIG